MARRLSRSRGASHARIYASPTRRVRCGPRRTLTDYDQRKERLRNLGSRLEWWADGLRSSSSAVACHENAKTKLVRHQDPRWDLARLLSLGQFDVYQEHQSKPVFECEFIVSFIGQSYSLARLIGVYAIRGREGSGSCKLPKDFLYPDMPLGQYRYRLERVAGYEDLDGRVVIAWGGSRSWHQWLKPKEIVEILPKGYVTEFPGYDEFILTFEQLREIIDNPTANREWHRMLAAVAGIYLITDGTTGKQYVGSAYGAEGILGRWSAYVGSGHGGNLLLRELLGGER